MKKIIYLLPFLSLSLLACNKGGGDTPEPEPPEPQLNRWYEYEDWWNYCSNGNSTSEATPEDVGKEVNVTVYDKVHKVRLIGVEHINAEGEEPEAHCTFEFMNVITDANGKAVTTYWNNKSGTESVNNNFPNSTLNDLLNNTKLDNCIFKVLPIGLQAAIKETNKKVGTREDDTETWKTTNYPTKLFPLAYDEMANHASDVAEGEGTKYQYYKDHKEEKDRIKRKVGSDTEDVGELYWIRSPLTSGSAAAWDVDDEGPIYSTNVFANMFAIAPAFCI